MPARFLNCIKLAFLLHQDENARRMTEMLSGYILLCDRWMEAEQEDRELVDAITKTLEV